MGNTLQNENLISDSIDITENPIPDDKKRSPRYVPSTTKTVITEFKVDGNLHCDDGPAYKLEIININHTDSTDPILKRRKKIVKKYYHKGRLHRDNGAAILKYVNNRIVKKEYFIHGLRHRKDGPAVQYVDHGMQYDIWYNRGTIVRSEKNKCTTHIVDNKFIMIDNRNYENYKSSN